MSNLKVLIVNDHGPTHFKPVDHLGMDVCLDHGIIDTPDEVGLVMFTGGHDVSPDLYGAKPHRLTGNSPSRDAEEKAIFDKALAAGIPMAGICRGSQFLCVMAGGILVQHITGHGRSHDVTARYPDGTIKDIEVTSTHHQMQYPFDMPEGEYDVLAWSSEQLSSVYCFSPDKLIVREEANAQLKSEPDVIWYAKIKALAAQYHPEWMSRDSEGFEYFQILATHYLKPLIEERDALINGGEKTSSKAG